MEKSQRGGGVMSTYRECYICGSDNREQEHHVRPVLVDGMCYEDVCGYCEEAGLHKQEEEE